MHFRASFSSYWHAYYYRQHANVERWQGDLSGLTTSEMCSAFMLVGVHFGGCTVGEVSKVHRESVCKAISFLL
jgi:hypothetical protein